MFNGGVTVSEAWELTEADLKMYVEIIKEAKKPAKAPGSPLGDSEGPMPTNFPPGYKPEA